MTALATDYARELGEAAVRAIDGYDLRTRLRIIAAGGCSEEMWRAFADDGWLGMIAPADHGGSALTIGEAGSILQAFGRRIVCEPIIPVAITAVTYLAGCAPSAARDAALAAITRGEMRAVLIDGEALTSGAAAATHLILGGASGSARLVPVDARGVTVTVTPAIDGSALARVTIEPDAFDHGDVLSPAPAALADTIAATRFGACYWALGLIDTALARTRAHVLTRQQFGRALGEFQAVRHRVADMTVAANLARAAVARNLALDREWRHQAALASYIAVMKAALRITRDAIQLHGGMGMTDELDVSHLYRAVLGLVATYGSVRDLCAELTLPQSAALLLPMATDQR